MEVSSKAATAVLIPAKKGSIIDLGSSQLYDNSSTQETDNKKKKGVDVTGVDVTGANIVLVKFDHLEEKNQHFETGDPVKCPKCGAIFTSNAKTSEKKKNWTCSFCETSSVMDDEMPPSSDVSNSTLDFLLSAPSSATNTTSSKKNLEASSTEGPQLVIFVIDISGKKRIDFSFLRFSDYY